MIYLEKKSKIFKKKLKKDKNAIDTFLFKLYIN